MDRPQVIAHRGGRKWAPENTLSAFRKSLELGVEGIELDVQRCSTGELVVFHDDDLSRTTNGAGLLADCSFDELRRLSAGLWFDKSFKDERVPLLSEVLDLIAGQIIINIEIKNTPIEYPGIIGDLLSAIENYPRTDRLIISSFDHKLMKQLHERAPDLEIALLCAAVLVDLPGSATVIGANYFHPAYDCFRADTAEEAHAAGLKVNAWTCNSQHEWRECIKMKLNGIVTDDPEGLGEFLARNSKGSANARM